MSEHYDGPVVILCTAPDEATASEIAETLVRERLAACTNIIKSVESVYLWEGVLKRDSECLLIIKTMGEGFESLRNRILDLHPYDTPEIITTPIVDGSEAYLEWLADSVDVEE